MSRKLENMSRAQLLLHVASAYKWRYLLWFLITLFVELLPLISGLVLQRIFNALDTASSLRALVFLLALFLTLPLARLLMIRMELLTEISVSYARSAAMREAVVARILRRPGARSLVVPPGEAISRLNDDVDEIMSFMAFLPQFLGITVFAAASTWIMLRIDARVTLAVVVPLLLVVGIIKWAGQRIDSYRRVSRDAAGKAAAFIADALSGVQAVQVSGSRDNIVRRIDELNDIRANAAVRERLLTGILDSVFLNTVHVAIGVIIIIAAKPMRTGQFSVGDLALFEYFLWFIRLLPGAVGQLITKYRQVGISIDRLDELRCDSGTPLIDDAQPDTKPLSEADIEPLEQLYITGLSYQHPGGGVGIENIDLSIPAGSLTVVIGPVGSGKTTLLRALLGLLPRASGTILWNGSQVADPATFLIPPRCGYVPQIPHLISASIRENILLGEDLSADRVTVAIDAVALTTDLTDFPAGLETVVGARATRLSGGQITRVATARALARKPYLLVLDDAASALDVETQGQFWQGVLASGMAALVVSHDPELLRRADRIIVMRHGKIEVTGTPEEIMGA